MRAALIILTIAALEATASAAPTAEDHFDQGQRAYDRGDFSTAIAEWRLSYQLSGESGLLFNLAQALRLAGDCAGALSTYQKFIEADQDLASEQHKLAQDLARELEPMCLATPTKPHDPHQELEAGLHLGANLNDHDNRSTRPGRTLRIAGLATGGGGITLLVTGLVVGRHANALGREVTDACASSCDWALQKSKDAAGRREAAIGYTLDAIGIVAITGGALMYYLGNRGTAVSVTPTARENGAIVSWSGSW